MDELVTILKKLGLKHKAYGVIPPHYDVVGQALIGTLGDAMGEKFTEEVKSAWVEIYGVISSTMIEGGGYEEEKKEEEEDKNDDGGKRCVVS